MKISKGFSVNSSLSTPLKVKAQGPGLEKTGVAVNKPAEFTVDARSGGKAPLKVQVQVRYSLHSQWARDSPLLRDAFPSLVSNQCIWLDWDFNS